MLPNRPPLPSTAPSVGCASAKNCEFRMKFRFEVGSSSGGKNCCRIFRGMKNHPVDIMDGCSFCCSGKSQMRIAPLEDQNMQCPCFLPLAFASHTAPKKASILRAVPLTHVDLHNQWSYNCSSSIRCPLYHIALDAGRIWILYLLHWHVRHEFQARFTGHSFTHLAPPLPGTSQGTIHM